LRIFHGYCYCLYCPSSGEIAEADNSKQRLRFQPIAFNLYLLSNPKKEKRKTKGLNFKETTHHTMSNLLQLQLIISDSNFSSLQNHNSGFLFFPSDLASAAFLRLKPKAKFTTFCYTFSPTLFIKKIKIKSISL
jgi:hypothetical protein